MGWGQGQGHRDRWRWVGILKESCSDFYFKLRDRSFTGSVLAICLVKFSSILSSFLLSSPPPKFSLSFLLTPRDVLFILSIYIVSI